MNVDFKVDNASLVPIKNTVIMANFDGVKARLQEMLDPFRTQVVTQDLLATAKSDRADINKIIKNIEDTRKTVKKVATIPLAVFEEKCKELVDLCRDAAGNLDGQIKAIEDREKQEKLKLLRDYFNAKELEFPEYISFEKIAKSEWTNKAYSISKAKEDIDNECRKNDMDVRTLKSINKNWLPALLDEYMKSRDFYKCMAMNERYQEVERREAERQRQAEIQKEIEKHHMDEPPKVKPAPKVTHVPEMVAERKEQPKPVETAQLFTVRFSVETTEAKLDMLQNFMDEQGIVYTVL